MRLTSTLAVAAVFAFAGFGLADMAWAQPVANWQDVQVNPLGASGGPLLYPGETSAPVQLHFPVPHRRTASVSHGPAKAAEAQPERPKRVATAKPVPAPKVAKAEPPAPATAPAPAPNTNPFGGVNDLGNVFGGGPKLASNAPPPQKTAPAGPSTGSESLSKRSVILFAKDAPDPAKSALGAIKFLASDLNSAMNSPGARVELQAFGGAKGDKSSDAHRLSLKRALAIRQVLIEDGVSADRIDVRAMGGVDDTGPADRVDVYVRA